MFQKLMRWTWQNNQRLWDWLKSQRFLIALLVFPFWLDVFALNLALWGVSIFMIGPVGFVFMAINGGLVRMRTALAASSARSGLLGKAIFGTLWAATSVVYGASRTIELVITLGEAADTFHQLEEG